MMQLLENFILSVGWLLDLFSSMNILICPISCNSHQISHILTVFYGDIGVYFYVCIKITFTIYYIYHKYVFVCILIMCMYVYWSYNEFKNYYLNSEIYCSKLIFQLWNVYIFELKLWYLNLRNIYVNLNFLFAFWFFCSNKNHYLSLKTVIPILKHFILI
jgi:hypothetical protein